MSMFIPFKITPKYGPAMSLFEKGVQTHGFQCEDGMLWAYPISHKKGGPNYESIKTR